MAWLTITSCTSTRLLVVVTLACAATYTICFCLRVDGWATQAKLINRTCLHVDGLLPYSNSWKKDSFLRFPRIQVKGPRVCFMSCGIKLVSPDWKEKNRSMDPSPAARRNSMNLHLHLHVEACPVRTYPTCTHDEPRDRSIGSLVVVKGANKALLTLARRRRDPHAPWENEGPPVKEIKQV